MDEPTGASVTLHDGLAVYEAGDGVPVLVLPYPHASTVRPMGEDHLTDTLVALDRRVVTFDPPGAYRSDRPMRCDLSEMLDCAQECLAVAGTPAPVTVVGHSMGALCALALAIERPQLVDRLVLVGGCSGFPAVLRRSTPHNWSPWRDREWWQAAWWGTRMMTGTGNLAVHKGLDNLVERASYVDPSHVETWTIEPGDRRQPAPPRARWMRAVRSVDFAGRLGEVRVPTQLLVGRHDPQTPVACAEELAAGIPEAALVVFERSGHTPFVEESERFADVVGAFLRQAG